MLDASKRCLMYSCNSGKLMPSVSWLILLRMPRIMSTASKDLGVLVVFIRDKVFGTSDFE